MKTFILIAFTLLLSSSSLAAGQIKLASYNKKPKLVVVLVVDQLRADYLTRFQSRFLPAEGQGKKIGGYQYLMARGAYYPFGEYEVLHNMTCVGHATILTGAHPHSTQIPVNDWFDRAAGKLRYCVQDEKSPLVGNADKDQIGVSPRQLATSTVGDELKNSGNPSRIVAVSLKDRSAILLGGQRADLAIWFDTKYYKWISSRFYLPDNELPAWVQALNRDIEASKGKQYVWESKITNGLSVEKGDFKRTAEIGKKESLDTPYGVDITTNAAIRAVKEYKLGSGKGTDILAVSYSTHDLLGHKVGTNARDMEEITVAEDKSFSELFNVIDRSIPGGIKNALIVLTADHGMAPLPKYMVENKVDAGHVDQKALRAKLNVALKEKFGSADGEWVLEHQTLNFFMNRPAAEKKRIAFKDIEDEARRLLSTEPGVRAVFTSTDVRSGSVPAEFAHVIKTTFVEGKSGDVVVIPKPYYITSGSGSTHFTAYSYDRSVPIAIAGPNVRAGVYAAPAKVVDIAPTLSFLLGVLPPTSSAGRVLSEAIAD